MIVIIIHAIAGLEVAALVQYPPSPGRTPHLLLSTLPPTSSVLLFVNLHKLKFY